MDERRLLLEQLRHGQPPMQLAYAPLVASGYATARLPRNNRSSDKSGNSLTSLFGLKRNKNRPTAAEFVEQSNAMAALHAGYAYGTMGTMSGTQVVQLMHPNGTTACYPAGYLHPMTAAGYPMPVNGSASVRCIPTAMPVKQRATILSSNWAHPVAYPGAMLQATTCPTQAHAAYALQHEISYAEQISITPVAMPPHPPPSTVIPSLDKKDLKNGGRSTLARLKRKSAAIRAEKLGIPIPSDQLASSRSELDLRATGVASGSLRASRSSTNLQSTTTNQFATVNERFLNLFRRQSKTPRSATEIANNNKKGSNRRSILDDQLNAYDLVRRELEGQPAPVKQNPLHRPEVMLDNFCGDFKSRSQFHRQDSIRSITPPPSMGSRLPEKAFDAQEKRRLAQSFEDALDKLHQNKTIDSNQPVGSLRIAGQGVNLFAAQQSRNSQKKSKQTENVTKEMEVDEEEHRNGRMHVYQKNFEKLPSMRKRYSVDSLPAMPEPDYDLEVIESNTETTKYCLKSTRLGESVHQTIQVNSPSSSNRCSSLCSSSSFSSSNSSSCDCSSSSIPSSYSNKCLVNNCLPTFSTCETDSANNHQTNSLNDRVQESNSSVSTTNNTTVLHSNGYASVNNATSTNATTVKSILKKSNFYSKTYDSTFSGNSSSESTSGDSLVGCGQGCLCQSGPDSVPIRCAQPPNSTVQTVASDHNWTSSTTAGQLVKSVSTFKCVRPKKHVHFRSSFDQTLIVEQIEHIMEESEDEYELEDLMSSNEQEEDKDSIILESPKMERKSHFNSSNLPNNEKEEEEEEPIYDDIGVKHPRPQTTDEEGRARNAAIAASNKNDGHFAEDTIETSTKSVTSTNSNQSTNDLPFDRQLSQELNQLVSEFKEFNPATQSTNWQKSLRPYSSDMETNLMNSNKRSTHNSNSENNNHTLKPLAITVDVSSSPIADESTQCLSSASSTCTYASCSSNYASDASSSESTYCGLDANTANRVSRAAILQGLQQTATATTIATRPHGSRSTDSGNHSDESLNVEDSVQLSSEKSSNLQASKIPLSVNKIVIDVPPADTYEPLQSEHIYEELRCYAPVTSFDSISDRKSIFEGASRQQILEYLADAKRRVERLINIGTDCDLESMPNQADVGENGTLKSSNKRSLPPPPPVRSVSASNSTTSTNSKLVANICTTSYTQTNVSSSSFSGSDCSECSECRTPGNVSIERQDSGVGPEINRPMCIHSRSLNRRNMQMSSSQITSIVRSCQPSPAQDACVDCEQGLQLVQSFDSKKVSGQQSNQIIASCPLLCNKCEKRRTERKEIIGEFVDTEFKYGRDLRIIREEFHRPMQVASLLSAAQLEGVFTNLDELIQVNSKFSEKLQDALDIATEQGDEDFTTVNIGRLFMESSEMLHSFESYCIRQASASLLLSQLEKEKELLRVFLRVSQMENPLLRRMNLNAFLMVPVQRVTKYPLLLNRLYKVTPIQHQDRAALHDAQQKVELHLEHINQQTKETAPNRIWRRISNLSTHTTTNSNSRRLSQLDDMIDMKVKKVAMEALQWPREQCEFILGSRLSYGALSDLQMTRKSRSLKMPTVNALLVVQMIKSGHKNGTSELNVQQDSVQQAAFLLIKEKNGRHQLCKAPLLLDACVISAEPGCGEYFELHEIHSKDSMLLKAESEHEANEWIKQLRLYSSKIGSWRKRRNALPNIMIAVNKS